MCGIQVGQKAPDFEVDGIFKDEFKTYKLSDYKGKWAVLFFYPLDFTFVCPTEIIAFSEAVEKFRALDTELFGISVDSKFSHFAWSNTPRNLGGIGKINYPLLADLNKTISRDYNVLLPSGVALRGLFIIDPEGTVQYSVIHNLGVGRSVEETLRVLQGFQHIMKNPGEVCPANWHKGEETMKADIKGAMKYFEKHG